MFDCFYYDEEYEYECDLADACDDVDDILYWEGSITRAELIQIANYYGVYVSDIRYELCI